MLEPDSEDRLLRIGLYETESKLDLTDTKLAAIPTQGDLTRVAVLALLTTPFSPSSESSFLARRIGDRDRGRFRRREKLNLFRGRHSGRP